MRTHSRFTKLAAALGSAALLFTACSDDPEVGVPDNPDEVEGKVVVWTYPLGVVDNAEWWQPHIDQFNEEYPNVEVEMVVQSWSNREENLVTAISGGNPPDVVYFNPDFIPKYAVEDLLLPLDELRDDWGDAYHESAIEAMTWDGTQYGSPLLMQMSSSYCRTDILEQVDAECPTDWDGMRTMGAAAKEAGFYLTEYHGQSTLNHTFYKFLWQAGGEVLNEDMTEAAFNGPEGLEALEFIKEMNDNGWLPAEPLTVTQPLEQTEVGRGEVAYVPGANLTEHRTVVEADLIETVPPMQYKEQVATGSVGGWSIFKESESVEAAQAFVDFMAEPDFMKTFLADSGYLPPRSDIDGLFEDDPQTAEGMDYLDTVRVGVMHPQAREIIDVIRPHIDAVLLQGADPQESLDAAAEEVNALLERG